MLAETYWELMRDPSHWFFELTLEVLTSLVFGFVVAKLAWPRFKRYVTSLQSRAISEEHDIHGIEDHDHELHEEMAHRVPSRVADESNRREELEDAVRVALYHLEDDDPEVAYHVLTATQEGR